MLFKNNTLYSIGHGHKTVEEFIDELQSFSIQFLVDVRTSPYSKWAPHFNRGIIEHWLSQAGIKYGYMGDIIGGKPKNDSCYDDEGYFDYHKMAEIPRFKEGLNRLVVANNKHFIVGIMCTETDPTQCHRSKLIGRELYFNHEINMSHIITIGKSVKQSVIMTELTKGEWLPEGNLFGSCEPPFFRSRKSYRDYNLEIDEY